MHITFLLCVSIYCIMKSLNYKIFEGELRCLCLNFGREKESYKRSMKYGPCTYTVRMQIMCMKHKSNTITAYFKWETQVNLRIKRRPYKSIGTWDNLMWHVKGWALPMENAIENIWETREKQDSLSKQNWNVHKNKWILSDMVTTSNYKK